MNVKVSLEEGAVLPKMATPGSSGYDLCANENITLTMGSVSVIRTGVHLELEQHTEAQIRSRSGLAAKHGVFVLNSPGTIDSDFRGEVSVILANCGNKDMAILKGARIAQMTFEVVPEVSFIVSELLGKTERGAGGLGSTGE
jgi:dUTP pyrophosphatase